MNEVHTNNPAFFPDGIDNAETMITTNESSIRAEDAAKWADRHLVQPSLPSNLDEAAQKVEDYYDVGEEHGYLCCRRGDIKDAFKAGAEWMAGQGFPRWRKIDEEKPKQGEACACIIVTINGHIKYSNFEDGPWRWDSEAKYISTDNEKGCFIENGYGEEETHTCSYWMPWDEFMGALEGQFKK